MTAEEFHHNLFVSALEESNIQNSIEDIIKWVNDLNDLIDVSVERIELNKLQGWKFDQDVISHDSGKFFSIIGLQGNNETQNLLWDQPIIYQPEIGILGFLTKKINGIIHFLIQAKIEPGNINKVQLSPTLQATRSNYMRIHKGLSPNYLKFFMEAKRGDIHIDQIQSEQGSRFLLKRNRNMIVYTEEDFEVLPNYKWVTLNQIKKLMSFDNLVNMDTKTILSNISFDYCDGNITKINSSLLRNSLVPPEGKYWKREILSRFSDYRSNPTFYIKQIPLNNLKEWTIKPEVIAHKENRFFEVQGAQIKIANREVKVWNQPVIAPVSRGTCILIGQECNNQLKFLFQFKEEIGIFDHVQLGPSIQTHLDISSQQFRKIEYAKLILDNNNVNKILFDNLQSEEGGRFYHEENRYCTLVLKKEVKIDLKNNFIWLTLYEVIDLIRYGYFVNIQARNLIAQIDLSRKW